MARKHPKSNHKLKTVISIKTEYPTHQMEIWGTSLTKNSMARGKSDVAERWQTGTRKIFREMNIARKQRGVPQENLKPAKY